MGGLIIFLAVAVPFLILGRLRRARQPGGARHGAGQRGARLRRRLDQVCASKRSLGVSGAPQARSSSSLIAIALWYVATEYVGPAPELRLRIFDASVDIGLVLSGADLPGAGRRDQRRQPDRRPRRAGGGLLRDRAARVHGDDVHHRARSRLALLCACLVGACVGFLWFNSFPAAVFMGDTGSLGLGGAIAGLAVMTQTEVLLI